MSVPGLEQAFAQWLRVPRAHAFHKGRVALHAYLKATRIGPGDEVIVPGFTCVMDVNPIVYQGAKPVYVDIDPNTFNADPRAIEAAVTPKTRLILAQHTFGIPCEMDPILVLAHKHGIPVLEDCCLSVGGTYQGQTLGTFGHAAYWSFQWNKPLTAGLGGILTTSDLALSDRVREVAKAELTPASLQASVLLSAQRKVHALLPPAAIPAATAVFRYLTEKGLVVGSSSNEEKSVREPPGFFRAMSRGQARAAKRALTRVTQNLSARRNNARTFEMRLQGRNWPLHRLPDHFDPVYVRYPVRVRDKEAAVKLASRKGIELGTWFESPLHPHDTRLEDYGYRLGQCPEAERACREVVNLPTHRRTGAREIEGALRVLATIGPPDQT